MKRILLILTFALISITGFSQDYFEGIVGLKFLSTDTLDLKNVFVWQGDTIRKDSIAYIDNRIDSIRVKYINGAFSKWLLSSDKLRQLIYQHTSIDNDLSSTNELNQSISFNPVTKELGVTDAGGTKSATINITSGNIVNSFTGTHSVTTTTTTVTFPTSMTYENYPLIFWCRYNKTINGKVVPIDNAVYDFTRTVNGFTFSVDTIAGKYFYLATDTTNLYPISFSNYVPVPDTIRNAGYVTNYKLKRYRLISDHDSLVQLQERSYNSLTERPDLSIYKLKIDSTALSGYFTNYKALNKVPYAGATKDVDLGNYAILASGQQLPLFNGACQISTITDNGNGAVTIGSGDYHISSLSTGTGTKKYTLSGGTFTLTDLTQNYIVADYNSGSPLIKVITDVSLINETTVIPIYSIFRNGTVLHIQNWDSLGLALANKVHQSIVKTQRYRRDQTIGGLLLTESGTRNLNLSLGRVWVGAVPVDVSAIASATDNIYFWYHSGGVWTSSVITQYPNTQYDNGTNLATLTVNRYAVCWIYRGIESQKHLYLVLGTGDYTLAQAESASQPAIPTAISSHAMLVAKLIVQNGVNTATSIQSAFDTQFSLSTVQSHQDLINRDAADTHPASSITNTPAGNVASTNVQTAINELDTEKKITSISFTSSAITTTQGDGTTASTSVPTFNQNTTGQAGYVANSQTIKFDTGTTEGTDLYTFNGSAAKTIDIKAGTNVTLTKAAGSITIASTATGGTTGIWTSLTGTYASATTFTFSGTDTDAKLVEMSLLTCTNSTGATRRIGYVKTATNSSGTITCNVVTDTDLSSGDKDFKIAYNQKVIFKPVTIPGEIIADASYSQGMFYYTSTASYLLPIDIIVRTPASGTGASCTVQVYKNATSLFSSAPDLSTNSTLLGQRPTTNTISAGDIVSVRIPASAGATNKAADIQVLLPIVQQSIFTAF